MTYTKGKIKLMSEFPQGGKMLRIFSEDGHALGDINNYPSAENDARRIKQCWNGYDELVGALGELIFLCDTAADFRNGVTDGNIDEGNINARKIIDKAKLALKNAGGNNA